jgi:hypothetical protein
VKWFKVNKKKIEKKQVSCAFLCLEKQIASPVATVGEKSMAVHLRTGNATPVSIKKRTTRMFDCSPYKKRKKSVRRLEKNVYLSGLA